MSIFGVSNKKICRVASIVCGLLIIPLVLTLLGSGVDGDGFHWTFIDFFAMFVLLFGGGFVYEFLAARAKSAEQRMFAGVMVAIIVLVVWAQLAVGAVSQLFEYLGF